MTKADVVRTNPPRFHAGGDLDFAVKQQAPTLPEDISRLL